ncbi:MAG: NUDIX domain-containing protein [Saprospiraceae bacterium]
MYKIYINETPLLLASLNDLQGIVAIPDKVIVTPYLGKKKFLYNYIDMLEKTDRLQMVVLHTKDVEQLFADFKSIYSEIRAGGGLVVNPQGEILFIFRRGMWDLPKGKMDKGETISETAIREVYEETGLKKAKLGQFLCDSYHCYKTKGGTRLLKFTSWFAMTANQAKLQPQALEDIEQAVWLSLSEFEQAKYKAFNNIHDVLASYKQTL